MILGGATEDGQEFSFPMEIITYKVKNRHRSFVEGGGLKYVEQEEIIYGRLFTVDKGCFGKHWRLHLHSTVDKKKVDCSRSFYFACLIGNEEWKD